MQNRNRRERQDGRKRITLVLDSELYKRFKVWCVENEKTFSSGIEYLISEFLKDKK